MIILSMEDYIEQIYMLIEEKGYVWVFDIVEVLVVYFFFVIKMV